MRWNRARTLSLVVLCALAVLPGRALAAQGGLLWEKTAQLPGGGAAEILSISTADGRVVTAGFGTTASGKAWWVRSHDVKTGRVVWEHVLNGGEAVSVKAGHGMALVGGSVIGPAGDRDILLVAYAASTGAILWSDRIDSGGEDVAASVGLAADGGRVSVAGTADGALLVRTYRTESGHVLWTDHVPGPHAVAAAYIDNWTFVCGSRGDGAAADFILRVQSVETGALRREHQADIAGQEDRCLAIAGPGGEIWAAGFATVGGQTDFLLRVYSTPHNNLILDDQFDLAGGDDKALAVAYQRNRAGATGFGTNASGNRDIVTRVFDLVHRELLWEDVQDPSGGGDDEGLAALVLGDRLFVAGRAGDHPLVMAFSWNRPKVLFWQAISSQLGEARAITGGNRRVFAAGFVKAADGTHQLWIVARDAF